MSQTSPPTLDRREGKTFQKEGEEGVKNPRHGFGQGEKEGEVGKEGKESAEEEMEKREAKGPSEKGNEIK